MSPSAWAVEALVGVKCASVSPAQGGRGAETHTALSVESQAEEPGLEARRRTRPAPPRAVVTFILMVADTAGHGDSLTVAAPYTVAVQVPNNTLRKAMSSFPFLARAPSGHPAFTAVLLSAQKKPVTLESLQEGGGMRGFAACSPLGGLASAGRAVRVDRRLEGQTVD